MLRKYPCCQQSGVNRLLCYEQFREGTINIATHSPSAIWRIKSPPVLRSLPKDNPRNWGCFLRIFFVNPYHVLAALLELLPPPVCFTSVSPVFLITRYGFSLSMESCRSVAQSNNSSVFGYNQCSPYMPVLIRTRLMYPSGLTSSTRNVDTSAAPKPQLMQSENSNRCH